MSSDVLAGYPASDSDEAVVKLSNEAFAEMKKEKVEAHTGGCTKLEQGKQTTGHGSTFGVGRGTASATASGLTGPPPPASVAAGIPICVTDDPDELMYADNVGREAFGNGDLNGLIRRGLGLTFAMGSTGQLELGYRRAHVSNGSGTGSGMGSGSSARIASRPCDGSAEAARYDAISTEGMQKHIAPLAVPRTCRDRLR